MQIWRTPRAQVTLVLLFMLVVFALRQCAQGPAPLLISSEAWDFNLETIQGDSIRLSDSQGKVRLLVFWAAWCATCLIKIPTLIELQEELKLQGLQVISINLDENPFQVMPAMLRRFRFNYPILLGNAEVTARYGGVHALPTSFIIDGKGTIREINLGLQTGDALRRSIQNASTAAN